MCVVSLLAMVVIGVQDIRAAIALRRQVRVAASPAPISGSITLAKYMNPMARYRSPPAPV